MPLPLFLALALQGSTLPDLTAAQIVVQPERIALTPKLDGVLANEEWDAFSNSGNVSSSFQWEPGKMHFAAKIPTGTDLLVSIDLGSDGWLIGKSNLEFRIGVREGKGFALGRLLDGTNINGPQWIELPGVGSASAIASSADAMTTTLEASLSDPGIGLYPRDPGKKLTIRFDAVPSEAAALPPYLPRVLAPVSLNLYRSVALPAGLVFTPEGEGTNIVPGEKGRLRLTFRGKKEMKLEKLALRSEGDAQAATNELSTPFPILDNKGRAFVDYDTNVAANASEGYRVLRGTLSSADGISAVVQASYRISPLADIRMVGGNLKTQPMDRSESIPFYINSNSLRPVTGKVVVEIPEPLRALNGTEKPFRVLSLKGNQRSKFDFYVPAKLDGTFPITFHITANGSTYDQVRFITIAP